MLFFNNQILNRLMKKKTTSLNFLIVAFTLLFTTSMVYAKTVNVTFRIGAGGLNTAAGVYVGSDWAGWDLPLFQKLADANNDSIFEITLPLTAGMSYNYRYTLGNYDWNNFEDLSGTACGFGPKKQDTAPALILGYLLNILFAV